MKNNLIRSILIEGNSTQKIFTVYIERECCRNFYVPSEISLHRLVIAINRSKNWKEKIHLINY